MSENEHRGIRDLSQYDSMPTEALEQILRADAETPAEQESDIELILYVMEVLARRKKENQQSGKSAQQSWKSFQQHYLPEQEIQKQNVKKPSGRPWLRRIAACAAAVFLILCIPLGSRALSLDELWDVVARWAKETFSFVSADVEHFSEPSPTYNGEYSSLQDVLRANNRDTSLVPTWVPDRYQLDIVEKVISPYQEIYIAHYVSDDGNLTLRIQTHTSSKPQNMEVGENILEIYSTDNIDVYIFDNLNQLRATWVSNSFEYIITGDISIEELKMMIDSI